MGFPIKTCVECGDEFELTPNKPGFANRCPSCSEPEEEPVAVLTADKALNNEAINAERRKAIKNLLYRGDA